MPQNKTIAGKIVIEPRRAFDNDPELRRDLNRLGYGRSRAARWSGSNQYNRSHDRELFTPRTPKELQEIRAKQRKAAIEAGWKAISA